MIPQPDAASLDALARQFDLSRDEVAAVVAAVMPEISRRIERNTLSRGGVADVVQMLGEAGRLDPAAMIGTEEGRQRGDALLETIFGTRDQSRAVAARASAASGIGDVLIKAMLPYIVSMVMKSLAGTFSGGLGDILAKIPNLGGARPAGDGAGGGGAQFPMPQWPTSEAPQTAPAPRSDRGGGLLPGPETMQPPSRTGGGGGYGGSPYGDLPDVIRRGGSGASVDGSPLWRVVRGVLGSLLGFRSSGLMSWIVRMVVMRYGWRIVTGLLRGLFMRR